MQKKEIIQISLTGVLVVIFFLIISQSLGKKKQGQKTLDENALSIADATIKKEKAEEGLYLKLEEETRNFDLIRDPFSVQPIKAVSDGSLYLSGIAWDEKNSTAIINGKIVKTGDTIDGYAVMDIKKNRVILSDGIKNLELNLGR